jgi:hypothetical protein
MYTQHYTFVRYTIQVLSCLFILICCGAQGSPVGLLIGKIVFPVNHTQTYKLSYEGQEVTTEIDGNSLVFRIPTSTNQWRFFILFIENFEYVLKEKKADIQQNTIDYQVAPINTPYRIFELHRSGELWTVIERLLPDDGRIPDSTIIVRCPAEYFLAMNGGNRFQLPTIQLKDNIVELAGSKDLLDQKSAELLIASLDFAPLNTPMKETKQIVGNRILLVPTA